MSEFLEVISPQAFAELTKLNTELDKIASKIKENNTLLASKTPSGATKTINDVSNAYKEQAVALDQSRAKISMIASLNKQRYQEEAKLIADNDKALTYKSEKELKQTRDKLSMIASLNKQRQQEEVAIQKEALANEKLNSAYNKLNASRTEAKNKLRDLIASQSASTAEIKKAQREFDVLDKKVRKVDNAVGDFSKSVGNYKTALSGVGNLMGAFGISTGLFLAVDIGRNIFETTKKLESMNLALKLVSETTDGLAQNQAFLANISEKWGLDTIRTTEQFIKFYADAKGKLSGAEIEEVFEGIAKAGSLMGLSIEKQESAFLAFQQMLSKGTVQAQELKLQLGDALPGSIKVATAAYQKLHPELKVTEALFIKHMEQGKVISSEMIPEMVRGYQKLYGIEHKQNTDTIIAAQNRLANSWTELVKSMNESETGGISQFFKVLISLADESISHITRLNNSWDILAKKAGNEGIDLGSKIFDTVVKDAKENGKNLEKEIGYTVENAKNKLKQLKEEEKILVDDINKQAEKENSFTGRAGRVLNVATKGIMNGFTTPYDVLQSKRELLVKEIKLQETLIKKGLNYKDTNNFKPKTPPAKTQDGIDAEKDKAKELEELRKNAYARRISDLEREKEQIKDLRDLETTSLQDKLFLEDAYAYKQIQINQTVYDEKIRLAEKNADLEQIALNELLTANEDALAESLAKQQKLKEDALKTDAEKTKEWYEKNPPMFVESKEQKEAREQAEKDIIEQQKRMLKAFKQFAGDFADNSGFTQTFDSLFLEDENGLSMFDKLIDKSEETKLSFQETFLVISSAAQDAFNVIWEMSQANFEAQNKRNEQQRDIALAFAGDSASAREEIEKQYQAKQNAIARKEAQAKKKQAMFNIAIDTAQAVMATLGKGGFFASPLAMIVAAMGAVQLAMVASQKIPEFWKGTDDAPEGLAWTQEKGREIITDKSGKIKSLGSDKGAQMTYLNKGDKVFNANDTEALMFDKSLNNMLMGNNIVMPKVEVSMDTERITNEIKSLANTIANKDSFTIVRDERGERVYQRKQSERKQLLNNVLTYKGFDV